MAAENLLMILEEIRELIQRNTEENGKVNFDEQKVSIALELARTELVRSLMYTDEDRNSIVD